MNAPATKPAAPRAVPVTGLPKRLATLKAHCALDGIELNPIKDDRGRVIYIVTKGPLTRQRRHLEAVEQWVGRHRTVVTLTRVAP